jgi:hypothetical protein
MEKTVASLLLTLVISVLGIPAAYLLGQRSAEQHYREEISQLRDEQRALVASLRSDVRATPPVTTPVEPAHVHAGFDEPARTESPDRETLAQAEPAAVEPTPNAPPPPTAEIAGPPIPEAAFDAAMPGTPYDHVVREFGREGEPMMTLEDGAGTITTQFVWQWRDADGTPNWIRMRFVDGLLIDKSASE